MKLTPKLLLLLLVVAISGCVSAPVREYDSENNAFAFGNITLPEDAGVVTGVFLYEVGVVYAPYL